MEELTPEELQAMKDNDDPVVIDVLPRKYFRSQHIPGAINIEAGDLDVAEDLFEAARPIVVYCMDEDCGASPKAASMLEDMGFENVYDLPTGIRGWEEAGNRVAETI